jgi:PAS domain S-box-containing protein
VAIQLLNLIIVTFRRTLGGVCRHDIDISPAMYRRPSRAKMSDQGPLRHAGSDQYWTAIEAVLITCAVVVLIEAAQVFWGLSVPHPAAFLLSAVALSAFRAGLGATVISVVIVVVYDWLHFSAPAGLFHYTIGNLVRVLIFTAAAPIVAALINNLRQRVKLADGERAVAAEQQRREQELRREPDGLQSVIQLLPLGLLMVDLTRNVVLSNPKMNSILRHPPAEFGCPSCERMFCEDRSSFMPADLPLTRILAGEMVVDQEVLYLRGDSTMIALRMNAAAVRDNTGKIIGAVLALEDITHERHLRQAAQELAAIVSTSDDAIYSVSMEGVILTWYRGAERVFGYTADEARYMSITMLLPPDQESEFHRALRGVRAGKHHQRFSTVLVRKDGSRVAVSTRLSPLYGKDCTDLLGVSVTTCPLEELAPGDQREELTRRVA